MWLSIKQLAITNSVRAAVKYSMVEVVLGSSADPKKIVLQQIDHMA